MVDSSSFFCFFYGVRMKENDKHARNKTEEKHDRKQKQKAGKHEEQTELRKKIFFFNRNGKTQE